MKLVSWNVNGYKSVNSKGFKDVFCNINADIFCIQETKVQSDYNDAEIPNYYQYWNYSEKKGYSGTAIFTKIKPLKVIYGLDVEELDKEGRVITLEYTDFFVVNTYTPCHQKNIERVNYRFIWDDNFIEYIKKLVNIKDVIICGDFNIAYNEMDLGNTNKTIFDFSDEERQQFMNILNMGFIDTFRYKNPTIKKFTWWKNNNRIDTNNACRLDYFLVSNDLRENIVTTQIRNDIGGSDHCPIVLKIKI